MGCCFFFLFLPPNISVIVVRAIVENIFCRWLPSLKWRQGGIAQGKLHDPIPYSIWKPLSALLCLHASKLLEPIYRNLSKVIQDPINSKAIQHTSKRTDRQSGKLSAQTLTLEQDALLQHVFCCVTITTCKQSGRWHLFRFKTFACDLISQHDTCLNQVWKMNERSDVPRCRHDWNQMLFFFFFVLHL